MTVERTSEHELGGVTMPPSPVNVQAGRALSTAATSALAAGERNEKVLTDLVFAARHPELAGRAIRSGETTLAREWLTIRDTLVRPALHAARQRPAESGAGQPRTTAWLARAWDGYRCEEGLMTWIHVLSNRTPVNPEAVGAFTRLAYALQTTGYQAKTTWSYNCRPIKGTQRWSLHSYGIAIDVDADCNPMRRRTSTVRFSNAATQTERCRDVAEDMADTAFTRAQVAAVESISTVDGLRVFAWGGRWRSLKDTMHFQLDVSPGELARGIAPG